LSFPENTTEFEGDYYYQVRIVSLPHRKSKGKAVVLSISLTPSTFAVGSDVVGFSYVAIRESVLVFLLTSTENMVW